MATNISLIYSLLIPIFHGLKKEVILIASGRNGELKMGVVLSKCLDLARCEKIETDFDGLKELITNDQWSQGVFEGGHRKKSNFLSADIIALDIDEDLGIEEAKERFNKYQCIIAPSRNHQKIKNQGEPSEKPACDRFRIVLFLEKRITDPEAFEATWRKLAEICPEADKAAKDASRFWFPSPDIYFENPVGEKVSVVEAIDKTSSSAVPTGMNASQADTKKLGGDTLHFISFGAEPGVWNDTLFKAACDFREAGFSLDDAISKLEQPTRLDGNKGSLDSADLNTIRSAYNRDSGGYFDGSNLDEVIDHKLNSEEILWPFLRYVNKKGETLIYQYTQKRGIKEVVAITPRRPAEFANHIYNLDRQEIKHSIESFRKGINSSLKKKIDEREMIRHIHGRWELNISFKISQEPVYITFDKGQHSFLYFDCDLLQPGSTSAWDEFLERLDQKCPGSSNVFLAWVWSILEPQNKGRQVLWIRGDGFDGKSVIANVLGRIIGGDATATIGKDSYDNRFFYSQVYGKRFVVYGDCKNSKLIKTEKIHSITGGDLVTVEYKGQPAFSARMDAKVLVCGNISPEISEAKNERTRLIYLEVAQNTGKVAKEGDSSWEDRLWDERFHMLYRAREAYTELCPSNNNIVVPESLDNMVDEKCGDDEEEIVRRFLDTKLILDANEHIEAMDMTSAFADFYLSETRKNPSPITKSTLTRLLNNELGLELSRVTVDGKRKRLYQGVKFKVNIQI